MRLLLALGAALALATAARAEEKPAMGPAPAWVRPVPVPAADANNKGAAVRVLLQDEQVALEPGRATRYTEVAVKIQNPQGLAAGNISLPWRPETDELTVHKLLIRRGDKVIDVLGSGQTFTVVRREANLESAMLDGVLTANIQPEGLQVGDVLEFAASVVSVDPVLKGHVEHIGGAWNLLPAARAHLRVEWPSSLNMRLRQTASMPALKRMERGGRTVVEAALDNVEPLNLPKGAPARFQLGRLAEFTDYESWSDLAALMAPLYVKAAALPADGPLQSELSRIKALSADPKVRTEVALALVQDRVRYVALLLGQGGYVPADAATTWTRRYGDCKGKTALLLALLHGLGIEAEPVAVSSVFGDGLDQRLPMVGLFNHVLVRAKVGGRDYWLDGTRTGDKRLDALSVPAFGWGLPLVPGAKLVRIMPPPLERPGRDVAIRIDASAGLSIPAPTRIETVIRGDEGVALNLSLANLTGAARERALRDHWKEQYDFVTVKSASANFDADKAELRLVMDGEAKMDWENGYYETDGTGLGWMADFSRAAGPDRDAPFAVPYPFYTRTVETILLPPGFSESKFGNTAEIEQTIAGVEFRRRARIVANTFTIEASQRSIAPEFPAKDAHAAQAALRALAEKVVYLKVPPGYRATRAETAAVLASTPTTATAFVDRGVMLLDLDRLDEAIADFDRAAALDPKDAWALANRGLAYAWKKDIAAAERDLDAATGIDPRNPVVFRARGLLAQTDGKLPEAIAAYTKALEIEPGNAFALGQRAEAYRAAGDDERALDDAASAIKLNPGWSDLYLMRANIFRGQGKEDQALAEAQALSAANPDDSFAQVTAARIYGSFRRNVEAMRAFDRALTIKPESYIFVNRSLTREKADVKGRQADLDAALRLDPKDVDALSVKARLQAETGDQEGAITTLSAALAIDPQKVGLLAQRGVAYARAGQAALADRDFAAARAKSTEPVQYNSLCWAKATAGVALESALADCDAALAKSPSSAAYLDSRGLVLLRLGRLDEALAAYDRALAAAPTQAASLFGRAVARARKGDMTGSQADLAAALESYPGIRDDFAAYGITL